MTSGEVEQSENDPVRADPDEVVEIARHPLAVIDRRQLRIS